MNKVSKVNTENLNDFLISSIDIQMAMMESYHDICKVFVNTILEQEVSTLTGEKYCHQKPSEGKFSRWGFNPGSFRVGSQRVPIQVPRVIDNQAGKTISLENYKRIREVPEQSDSMIQSVLHGLSMRDYGRTAETLAGSFGLSAASISNEFVEHSKLPHRRRRLACATGVWLSSHIKNRADYV